MPEVRVTVAIPTLAADEALADCIRALEQQTLESWEAVVIDNSGRGLARRRLTPSRSRRLVIVESSGNLGYGAAVNRAAAGSQAEFVAALNDDAAPHPEWLAVAVAALERDPRAGMCACQVRLAGADRLDSAGMLIAGDGTSKQRGQGRPPAEFASPADVLAPSGSAALYRRRMLEETGGFDESFFLYCEDTDLGLRARWAGWTCVYAPDAVVEHRYSQTAGSASRLKAYLVERNRLLLVFKNFPLRLLWRGPLVAVARYFWHAVALARGHGAAGRYREDGSGGAASLVWIVVKAHVAALWRFPRWWPQRRRILRTARITSSEFAATLARHSLTAREVALL